MRLYMHPLFFCLLVGYPGPVWCIFGSSQMEVPAFFFRLVYCPAVSQDIEFEMFSDGSEVVEPSVVEMALPSCWGFRHLSCWPVVAVGSRARDGGARGYAETCFS